MEGDAVAQSKEELDAAFASIRETLGRVLRNDSREKSLALTKLDECEMWAGKAVQFVLGVPVEESS